VVCVCVCVCVREREKERERRRESGPLLSAAAPALVHTPEPGELRFAPRALWNAVETPVERKEHGMHGE